MTHQCPFKTVEHRETTKTFHLMRHQVPFWCGIRCKTFLEHYGCGCVWAVPESDPKTYSLGCLFVHERFGGSQEGGFQKGGFGGCSPGTKTGTRARSPKPPFWKPPFYLPMTLFGVDKRVVSKRVVSADVPPERKPERGYVRQNHPFTEPPFYLPVKGRESIQIQQAWAPTEKQIST